MAFIDTIPDAEATGSLKTLYETAEAGSGYIPNYLRLFSYRPDVYSAWQQLSASIRANMTLRRYELVTLAAARRLEGTYCMMAHADTLLNSREVDSAQLIAIATDHHKAMLTPVEVAIMDFAEKVIVQSCSVTQADVDHLKTFGLIDAEILDIVLAASVRSFFSRVLDALNAEPDAKYLNADADLRAALTVGRSF